MEFREGSGMVLFCQMDVTQRTEDDPQANARVCNGLRYAAAWTPEPRRHGVYIGGAAGKDYLKSASIEVADYHGDDFAAARDVLIVGPGGGPILAPERARVARFLDGGGRLLAIGLDQEDADAFLAFKVGFKRGEHVSAAFEATTVESPLAGVGPADAYNRSPREFALISSGATVIGDGVLALAPAGAERPNVVFCQLAPWQFDEHSD